MIFAVSYNEKRFSGKTNGKNLIRIKIAWSQTITLLNGKKYLKTPFLYILSLADFTEAMKRLLGDISQIDVQNSRKSYPNLLQWPKFG